ncbi:MAG: LarC family nickel insertion protein, partial [Cyanobacteria bacterium J06632_22]
MDNAVSSTTASATGKMAYLDCPSGIAGDMCLGAIVDAGMPLATLIERLAQLGLSHEYRLVEHRVQRQSQIATQVQVQLVATQETPPSHQDHRASEHPPVDLRTDKPDHHGHEHDGPHHHEHHGHDHHGHDHHKHHGHDHHEHHHSESFQSRRLPEIETIIRNAQLTPRATAWSLAVFRRLAEAEAAVHGIPPEQVHFHEVGATDAIVDIVGTCIGLDWLGIDQVYCSALPVGGGTVMAAHGRLPVPAPAVLRLLTQAQAPVYSNGIETELVTPTGAAIATTLSTRFGAPPA